MSFLHDAADPAARTSGSPAASPAPGRSTLTSRHVMRKARGDADEHADAAVEQAAVGSGAPLPGALRDRFESSLGADLSDVRVHTGDASAAANDAVGARAYATGNDIHFGAGQYDPGSSDGQFLIAHEVAHTVQQSGGAPRRQLKLAVSSPGDTSEVEADAAASAMVSGAPASVTSAGLTIARSPLPAIGLGDISYEVFSVKLGHEKVGVFDADAKAKLNLEYKPPKAEGGEPKEGEGGKKGVEIKIGSETDKKGSSITLEAKKELESGWNVKPSLFGKAKFGPEGVELDIGVEASHELVDDYFKKSPLKPKPLTFSLAKWAPGEPLKIGVLGLGWELSAPIHYKGHEITLKAALEFEFGVDAAELSKWIAEELGTQVLAEAALIGGIIGAGLFTVAYGFIDAFTSSDIETLPEAYGLRCLDYARGFQAGVRDLPKPTGKEHSFEFAGKVFKSQALQAWEAGQQDLEARVKKLGVPRSTVIAELKKHNVAADAWKQKWPSLKALAIETYKNNHGVEMTLSGGDGWGSGGLVTFKSVLDGYDTGPYSEG